MSICVHLWFHSHTSTSSPSISATIASISDRNRSLLATVVFNSALMAGGIGGGIGDTLLVEQRRQCGIELSAGQNGIETVLACR